MSTTTTSLQGTSLALPSNLNAIAKPAATTTTSSTTSADGGLGSTFLSLLSQELQNQDPTAPVDSTAMVGQMISLNQLDQLINIAQSVQSLYSLAGGSTSTTSSAAAKTNTATQPVAAATSTTPASAAAATSYQLPFDPNTMMPINMQNPSGSSSSPVPAAGASASIIK